MDHYYIRRKENIVDLSFDPEPLNTVGVDGFRIKHASNFDQSFSKLVDIPLWGGRSGSVSHSPLPSNVGDRFVRYIFDPTDFSLEDDTVHFLQVTSLDGSTEKNTGRKLIVLTPDQVGTENPVLVLRGTAPKAADFDGGEHLVLPSTAVSYDFDNLGGETVYLGFGSEGSELQVSSNGSKGDNRLNVDRISFRTDSGATSAVEIQLYLVLAQGPAL